MTGTSNVTDNTEVSTRVRDYLWMRMGQKDHNAITKYWTKPMSRRGIHPLLMGLDKPKNKPIENKQAALTGYESAQRKRFLRAEAEECKQDIADARRSLLALERQA